MLSEEKYFFYLKKSIPSILFSKKAPLNFDDLITTVQDFNFYFGELREHQQKVENKEDIKIFSATELLKLGVAKKSWLKKISPDKIFIFDITKLGTKIRRAFENTLFRVSIYRDNVISIINELGYFWLDNEPRSLLSSIPKSRRLLLFPKLGKISNNLSKLEEIISLRNKITHKTHLKVEFEAQVGEDGKFEKIMTGAYESSFPMVRAMERYRGTTKTIDYYIEKIENIYPTIISINEDLVNYYFMDYSQKEWTRCLDKRFKKRSR